jgi:hypothetical protein
VQAVPEAQDTVLRLLSVEPDGWGVLWIAQDVPFHRSASVPEPELVWSKPTTVQALAAVQDMPSGKALTPAPERGVFWIVQDVPFHSSASMFGPASPTAIQRLAEVQATVLRRLKAERDGLGVLWMAQDVPSHRSASVK